MHVFVEFYPTFAPQIGAPPFLPTDTDPSLRQRLHPIIRLKPFDNQGIALIKIIYPFIKRNDTMLFILFSIDCCTFVLPKQKTGQFKRICYEQ